MLPQLLGHGLPHAVGKREEALHAVAVAAIEVIVLPVGLGDGIALRAFLREQQVVVLRLHRLLQCGDEQHGLGLHLLVGLCLGGHRFHEMVVRTVVDAVEPDVFNRFAHRF